LARQPRTDSWSDLTVRLARTLAGLAVLTAALGAAAVLAAPAASAAPTGMTLDVRSDAGRLVAVLTNRGDQPCQLAVTPLGTVAVTGLTQGGRDVQPDLRGVEFRQAPEVTVQAAVRALAPGESVTVPLPAAPDGAGKYVLETITLGSGGGTALRYPVAAGDVDLALTYSVPVAPKNGAPCADAAGHGTVALDPAAPPLADGTHGETEKSYPLALLLGGAGGVVLLVGLTVLLLRRRNRPATLALLVLAGTAVGVAGAREARADITVAAGIQQTYDSCAGMLKSDPAHLLPTVDSTGFQVTIFPSGDGSHTTGYNNRVIISWDPSQHLFDGSLADTCLGLYHELSHATEHIKDNVDKSECVTAAGPSGISVTEVNATRAENALAVQLGLSARDNYGGIPLPTGECENANKPGGNGGPPPPTCPAGAKCGDSNGDPHLYTLDGRLYDFQAVGDFVLSADPTGGFAVQVRNTPVNSGRLAAITTRVGADVAGDKVELSYSDGQLSVRAGAAALPRGGGKLPAGGTVAVQPATRGPIFTVTWPDGSRLLGQWNGRYGARLIVAPAKARLGRMIGLLGNGNGNPGDDYRSRGGGLLTVELGRHPTHDQLYPRYADSWRVPPDDSLFSTPYGPIDRTFPDPEPPALPGRASAEALCRKLGVTEAVALADCAYDVAVTGRTEFAVASALAEDTGGTLPLDGAPRTVHIGPKQRLNLSVDGTAGQTLFVRVTASTLPNQCGVMTLHNPDGTQLASGCIISGVGDINSVKLPVTGRYQVQIHPEGAGGNATVAVNTAAPKQATLPADHPTEVRVTAPGGTVTLPFAGRAGQVAVVNVVAGTLPNQCGVLSLTDPVGGQLAGGCIISGTGGTTPVRLKTDGTYTLTVDPQDANTGSATLLLSVGTGAELRPGDSATLTIAQPRAVPYLSFTARAGQTAVIDVTASTLGTTCSTPRLIGPDTSGLGSGCVSGDKGTITAKLPTAGRYVLYYNPDGTETGTAQIRLSLAG
jgi:von Willebrand factor type D domain